MTDFTAASLAATDVPGSDWPMFRWDLHQTVARQALDELDAAFVSAATGARTWVIQASDLQADDVAEYLISEIRGCRPAFQVTIVRGIQLGLFSAGWHLKVSPDRVLANRASEGTAAISSTIVGYRHPIVWALAEFLRLTNADRRPLLAMQVQDVTEREGTLVATLNGRLVRLDEGAARPMHAYLLWRLFEGAADDEPLWVAPASGEPLGERNYRTLLRKVSQMTGEGYSEHYSSRDRSPLSKQLGIVFARISDED